jgi:hypothetical protein
MEAVMMDLAYIGLTLAFCALSYGFILVCDRLMEAKP